MKLFLDTSVLLAASNSPNGGSRAIFSLASKQGWTLIACPWVVNEVTRNLAKFPVAATEDWLRLREQISLADDVVSLDRALVFSVSKDHPVLVTALAAADVLLTLDRGDFLGLLGAACYWLPILTPSDFLNRERANGRLHD